MLNRKDMEMDSTTDLISHHAWLPLYQQFCQTPHPKPLSYSTGHSLIWIDKNHPLLSNEPLPAIETLSVPDLSIFSALAPGKVQNVTFPTADRMSLMFLD
jgi:hypothetical protein